MSKMPRIYADSTIERMYRKLALPDETIKLLFNYLSAMANLYQLLPLKDAYKIISGQNKGMITEEQFIAFSEIARHEEHEYYILSEDELYTNGKKSEPMDRTLLHESLCLCGFDEYYELEEEQYDKPLCILPKDELLRYTDDSYIPDTPQTRAMTDFLRKTLKMNKDDAEDVLAECNIICRLESGINNIEMVFSLIEKKGFFMSEAQLKRFISLYQDLHNNSRKPANRGFTPNELRAKHNGNVTLPKSITFGPNISNALRNGTMNANELGMQILCGDFPDEIKRLMLEELKRQTTVKPISRNAPCPCGSGKKYKHCCGK